MSNIAANRSMEAAYTTAVILKALNALTKCQLAAAGSEHGLNERWHAGKNCVIKGAILDDNVSLGDNCQITNKDGVTEADRTEEGYAIQDGIVTILRNAAIPAGTTI